MSMKANLVDGTVRCHAYSTVIGLVVWGIANLFRHRSCKVRFWSCLLVCLFTVGIILCSALSQATTTCTIASFLERTVGSLKVCGHGRRDGRMEREGVENRLVCRLHICNFLVGLRE